MKIIDVKGWTLLASAIQSTIKQISQSFRERESGHTTLDTSVTGGRHLKNRRSIT